MSTVPSSQVKRIAVGADHGGFPVKQQLCKYLAALGYQVDDVGTEDAQTSVDYPLFAAAVARRVADGHCQRGIMIDGAGIGSCMAANKIDGVRAAMVYDVKTAVNSRAHNNANVLTLGGPLHDWHTLRAIVDEWLKTDCSEARHLRRADQILQLEDQADGPRAQSSPTTQANGVPVSSDMSPEDLQQIALQITEILRSQGIGADSCDCTCCGGSCGGHCAEQASGAVRELIGIGASRITYRAGGRKAVPRDLAGYIDHTLLKPDADASQIEQLCDDAREHNFASVCISPTYVKLAAGMLRGSAVKVCTVVGFPSGTHLPAMKALEARQAIRDGAGEIDMVINIGALKSRDMDLLYKDIRSVVEACNDGGALCKVIIETALLTDEEKVLASETAKRARADFVKTSTGFASGGATAHDVALMAGVVRDSGMGVKASGGIRSKEDALKMIEAGATRIGASASVQIVQGGARVTESY